MRFKVLSGGNTSGTRVVLRCPQCRQIGTFEPFVQHDRAINTGQPGGLVAGQRRCPDPECHCHIFFVAQNNRVLATYPAERIDFDASHVPSSVSRALEEALTCHANGCYTAAAIMVRKTLEELCDDRKAEGDNLKKRLEALRGLVVLPNELLDGLDDLRLLGNDAAHIESETYTNIGKSEVELAVDVTKEVLKGVYQYQGLVGRLQALKKQDQ